VRLDKTIFSSPKLWRGAYDFARGYEFFAGSRLFVMQNHLIKKMRSHFSRVLADKMWLQ
jgi:hypothetical protein